MNPVVHSLVLSALLAGGAAQAATSLERVRDDCATEISMMCAGRKDVLACLTGQRDYLTPRCRNALKEDSQSPAAPQPANAGDAVGSSAAVMPQGASAVPGVGNVWFRDDYSGPLQGLYPKFRNAVGSEAPGALREVAKLLGQDGYAAAFPRPLVLRVEYDPTQQNGLGSLDPMGNAREGQRVTFNMAYWEDCPSRPILRSVVAHEFAHAALHDLVGESGMTHVPQWFDEGLGMLAGGEPALSISLDAAYYRHGGGYPGALTCRLDNEGPGLLGGGLLTDCYPYYLLAVRHIVESSPEALPSLISDLRSGTAIEQAIPARTGLSWAAFEAAVDERVRRTFKRMSPLSRLTGRNWWRHVRWCRG